MFVSVSKQYHQQFDPFYKVINGAYKNNLFSNNSYAYFFF